MTLEAVPPIRALRLRVDMGTLLLVLVAIGVPSSGRGDMVVIAVSVALGDRTEDRLKFWTAL